MVLRSDTAPLSRRDTFVSIICVPATERLDVPFSNLDQIRDKRRPELCKSVVFKEVFSYQKLDRMFAP